MTQSKPLKEQLPLTPKTNVFSWLERLVAVLEPRLASLEINKDRIDDVIATIREAAIARMDDTLTPLVADAVQRVSNVTRLFQADIEGSVTIDYGDRFFQVAEADRITFVPLDYVVLRSKSDAGLTMLGSVTSYDRNFGVLRVLVSKISGAGTFSDFTASLAVDPQTDTTQAYIDSLVVQINQDIASAVEQARLSLQAIINSQLVIIQENAPPKISPVFSGTPRAPTAALGTNTDQIATAEFVQAAITALKTFLTNGAGTALDQFNELANALGNDPNFSTTVLNALGNRLRFDAAQSLTSAQKSRGLSNLGAQAALPGTPVFRNGTSDIYLEWQGSAAGINIKVDSSDMGPLWNNQRCPGTTGASSQWTQKFSNGTIIQGGFVSATATQDLRLTFPTAFPNECRGIFAQTAANPSSSEAELINCSALTRTAVDIRRRKIQAGGVFPETFSDFWWWAVGR